MEKLMILISVTSIWVLGITIVTSEGMVLYPLRRNLTDQNGDALRKIYEPLLVCVWCMPSIHSIIGVGFSVALGWVKKDWTLMLIYPLVIMGSSIVSGMIWTTYQYLVSMTSHYRKAEELNRLHISEIHYRRRSNKQKNNNNEKKHNAIQSRKRQKDI